jgi:cytochrome c biogenesis protein ResB
MSDNTVSYTGSSVPEDEGANWLALTNYIMVIKMQ